MTVHKPTIEALERYVDMQIALNGETATIQLKTLKKWLTMYERAAEIGGE